MFFAAVPSLFPAQYFLEGSIILFLYPYPFFPVNSNATEAYPNVVESVVGDNGFLVVVCVLFIFFSLASLASGIVLGAYVGCNKHQSIN